MDYKNIIIDSILFISLLIAVITDLKTRKIYNKLTYPVAMIGILLNGIFYGLDGIKNSAVGWVVGVIVFMLFGFGGGDIKLMGAVGALKGWLFVLISVVYISIAGGIFTVIYLIYKNKLLETLKNTFMIFYDREKFKKKEKTYIPYGPAIKIGIIWYYFSTKYDFLSLMDIKNIKF